ncbi:MAG: M36 family metallopeptidase [Micromonosporaceae bacterium]
MTRFNPSADARTRYDGDQPTRAAGGKKARKTASKSGNGTAPVRSFFGAELVEGRGRKGTTGKRTSQFLKDNADKFGLEGIELEPRDEREGAATASVRYRQTHHGIPVHRSQLVVALRKSDGAVISATNEVDYQLPAALGKRKPRLSADQALDAARERFAADFAEAHTGDPELYVYRHRAAIDPAEVYDGPPIRARMMRAGSATEGTAYLTWRIPVDTENPDGEWIAFLDADSGELLAVLDQRRYATTKAYVFSPDPITYSQNDNLTWSDTEATLNAHRVEVTLENLNTPSNGSFALTGSWVRCIEKEAPTFNQPTAAEFKYGSKQREFLSTMAYYWVDRIVTYLRSLGVTGYNTAVTGALDVDAQSLNGADNSHFSTGAGGAHLCFGEGGVPDANDAHVIIHEYGHTMHWELGADQNGPSGFYEEGMVDLLAAAYLDRFNTAQYHREQVFPWDNNKNINWDPKRRLDLPERFDDAGFASYGAYHKGDILATALWDIFLNIGGASAHPGVRQNAADTVVRTMMEMLLTVADERPALDLANGWINADVALTGGLHRKVAWDAFRRRGLWSDFTPTGNTDVYIRDSAGDTGEHSSPEVHWASPDLWVRLNPPGAGENPDDGHQPPILNQPNYLYVRVHNRGSAAASGFNVTAYHCDPATAMLWPTHFTSMGALAIPGSIPAGGSTRVGPFIWTPTHSDHECLFAVAHGASDPAITSTVTGQVDHWKLVRFDNNVGQRNVQPVYAVPGGKLKTSFLMRGSDRPTTNRLTIDAGALPGDTAITVSLPRRLGDAASGSTGLTLVEQTDRIARYALNGGHTGSLDGFEMPTSDEATVTLDVDFSVSAQHLKTYPIIATQEQDGEIAGRLSIELTAVKETDDFVYGNPRSLELHTVHCPLWPRISQRNKVPYREISDGVARGYNGCAFCLPEHHTG